MKRIRILIPALILAVALAVSLFPATALAASASVSVSKSTIEVGDTVKATFRFSANNIFGAQAKFSYDKSMLTCVSSSSSGISTNGNIALYASDPGKTSVSGSVTFKALKAGTAKISVTASEILDYDENNLGGASGSKSITVVAEGTLPTPTPKPGTSASPSPTPSFDPAKQAVPATAGTKPLYVWKDLTGVTLPAGATAAKATFSGNEIQVAQTAGLTLCYTTDDKGANGAFYVLDPSSGSLFPYLQLAAGQAYTLVKPASTVTIPQGYIEKSLTLQEQTVQAWVRESETTPEFYLIYAMNPKGTAGFYLYDTTEGTIQRYTDRTVVLLQNEPVQPVQETIPEPAPKGFFETLSANPAMMAVMIVLAGAILIAIPVIVVLLLKLKKGPAKPGKLKEPYGL